MATSPTRTNSITRTPRYNGQRDTKFSTPIFSISSSPSYSSNSSFGSHSFHDHDSPFSPNTPLPFSKGVPFSWEHIPGIPKENISRKNSSNSSSQLLPLPPPAGNNPPHSAKNKQRYRDEFSPKKNASESFRKDPFFAAFVEVSKDNREYDIWKSTTSKVTSTRNLSDRFGFISTYASCKSTCSVSESIVYHPRSRNYDLLTRRTSR